MSRPLCSVDVRTLALAACLGAFACDAGSRTPDGSGGEAESVPVGSAPVRLEAVPEPAIDWRPEVYLAPRTNRGPDIDGSLGDPAWIAAPWTADFVDIRGGTQVAPRHRTRARILWDDDYLYVAAEMEEPHVWGTLTERDAVIYHDNDFEVFIDPDADTHLYYELEINALNTVWDLMLIKPYRDGGPAIDSWDIGGLRTAVATSGTVNDPSDTDRGWSVEIAIPWGALEEAAGRRVPPAPGDRWRVNFSRVQWRSVIEDGRYVKAVDSATGETLDEDNWVWSPQGIVAMHYPEMWGIVEFVGRERGDTDPRLTESEGALWALRQLYYRQRQHAAVHGTWASEARDLDLPTAPAEGLRWPPSIFPTPSGFEATLPLSDGRVAHIAEDGRSWVSD